MLDIIRVFQGSFGGQTIFQNAHYVSPNKVRHEINAAKGTKYKARVDATDERSKRHKAMEIEPDEVANVFKLDSVKKKTEAGDDDGDDDDDENDEDGDGGSDDDDGSDDE